MPELSICMVSLNCRKVVEDCLVSLRRSKYRDYEILMVDNGSVDGTLEYLRAQPDVVLIENGYNAGFTKATNQGIAVSSGKYLLWLNTDTILNEDTLFSLIDFLRTHPRAGIVGPRVLNPDGTFQAQCKRGVPTPLASLAYATRLDRLFPRSRKLGAYYLNWISDRDTAQVDAVSGCCLLARREVLDTIGPLDEEMFGFGEDIDWCVRAAKGGWEVWYYPGTEIIHLKGAGGAHSKPYHKIWGVHQCMWLFYRKHLRSRYSPLMTAAVATGIATRFSMQIAFTWLKRNALQLAPEPLTRRFAPPSPRKRGEGHTRAGGPSPRVRGEGGRRPDEGR